MCKNMIKLSSLIITKDLNCMRSYRYDHACFCENLVKTCITKIKYVCTHSLRTRVLKVLTLVFSNFDTRIHNTMKNYLDFTSSLYPNSTYYRNCPFHMFVVQMCTDVVCFSICHCNTWL